MLKNPSFRLRPFAHAALAALVLVATGCGRPDIAPQASPARIQAGAAALSAAPAMTAAEAAEADNENEPGWKAPASDLGHFFQVDENLYRGQQPTDKGLAELKARGIKTVVYLHFSKKQAAHEKAVVEGLGMKFVHIPMSWITPPKQAQIDQWLKITSDPAQGPVFVHCQHGKDRTGAMVGIYRMKHDGWKYDQAYKEMKEKGYRTFLIGLTYGVRRFANQLDGAPAPAPAPALAAR